jgi:antitoxin (DNA-binding transcriptional repressor) of toxin-antitoxin stability system
MARQVTLNEAQIQLRDLVGAVKRGETVVIAQNDQPVVQLVAITPAKRHALFGSAADQLVMAEDFDAPLSDFTLYTA